jgi:hypothetical protein
LAHDSSNMKRCSGVKSASMEMSPNGSQAKPPRAKPIQADPSHPTLSGLPLTLSPLRLPASQPQPQPQPQPHAHAHAHAHPHSPSTSSLKSLRIALSTAFPTSPLPAFPPRQHRQHGQHGQHRHRRQHRRHHRTYWPPKTRPSPAPTVGKTTQSVSAPTQGQWQWPLPMAGPWEAHPGPFGSRWVAHGLANW